jgi:hypothetical protein
MNRRNFLAYTASSAGILLPAMHCFAASPDAAQLSVSGDVRSGAKSSAIIEGDFRGV